MRDLRSSWRNAGLLLVLGAVLSVGAGAQAPLPAAKSWVDIKADKQWSEGDVVFAEGNVDITYQDMRLRADHIEYNVATHEAVARGHVKFDFQSQHLEAEQAHHNVRTNRGRYWHVRGTVKVDRRLNPYVLVSPNPLYFEADEVERLDERTYKFRKAWLTVCTPDHPQWKFYASHATLTLDSRVALVSANFRMYRIPLFYFPYATLPAARKVRHSGFLIPHFSTTNTKGVVLGDSYYWAPTDWLDLTAGGELYSSRGWSQIIHFRALPWEGASLSVAYFGVVDRGLPQSDGTRPSAGGHTSAIQFSALLPKGWRAVADQNQLSSFLFRLTFSATYHEALQSEIHSAAFLTNNFRGFSLNFAARNYKNFLGVRPSQGKPDPAVTLRQAPGVRFSSVEQAPWHRWPVYLGFHTFVEGVYRDDKNAQTGTSIRTGIRTGPAVLRSELAPRITVPLRWGPWVGVTPTFSVRTTYWGSQLLSGTVVGDSLRRTTEELTVDIRPPSLARIWEAPGAKWKHVIEPQVVYRLVNGVNHFERLIRFDENETLTNTNEVEYSIAQRLYRRKGEGQANDLISWRVAQKYYFDSTFGGAITPPVPNPNYQPDPAQPAPFDPRLFILTRNVFQALDSITPFAFADGPRRYSPIVSDLRLSPGDAHYDAGFRVDYDPARGKVTSLGAFLNAHPYRQSFLSVSDFTKKSSFERQPSNQISVLVGWGQMNRRGWNSAFSLAYDARQHFFIGETAQVSYNGSCCGVSFEYRRFAPGILIRGQNQFRFTLLIANIGTFGTLRRQERIF